MDDFVVVGRIGRPHGLTGEVFVEPRTDEPERRFADGRVLVGGERSLTVASSRWHQGRRLLVRFEEIGDRTVAEDARGLELVVPLDPSEETGDPEEFYDHQLVGLRAVAPDGSPLGEVRRVVHGAAQDLLVVVTGDGREVLVPFVTALVPAVEPAARRLIIDDRPGLFEES